MTIPGDLSTLQEPTYSPVTFDMGQVSALRQGLAQPQVSKLRRQLQAGLAGRTGTGFQRAKQAEALMSGYGQGLSGIMTGAEQQAWARYLPQLQEQQRAAAFNYQRQLAEYQAQQEMARQREWQDYIQEAQREREEEARVARGEGIRLMRNVWNPELGRHERKMVFMPHPNRRTAPLSATARATLAGMTKSPSGFTIQRPSRAGLATTPTAATQPGVNPAYWPGGYQQQQTAMKLSESAGVPLSAMTGDVDPEIAAVQWASRYGG